VPAFLGQVSILEARSGGSERIAITEAASTNVALADAFPTAKTEGGLLRPLTEIIRTARDTVPSGHAGSLVMDAVGIALQDRMWWYGPPLFAKLAGCGSES
jgi:hypothetical protein